MRDYLMAQIEKRRADVDRLQAERQALARQIETIAIELRTFTDVLRQLEDESNATSFDDGTEAKRTRFAEHWQAVIRGAVERYPNAVTNGEVPGIMRAAGYAPVKQEAIRSHIWSGARAELYEKLGQGRFRATQKAADVIGLKLGGGSDNQSRAETETPNSGTLFGAPKTNGAEPLSP
jgi:hypothetical protein